jgi:predicted nucleotidyltransferase
MELEEFRKKVTAWAINISYIRAVILYGSRAKGTFRKNSDWDICCLVDGKPNEGWYGIWLVEAEEWKIQFCKATGLSYAKVQFTAPTSNTVINGLFECSRILYLRLD